MMKKLGVVTALLVAIGLGHMMYQDYRASREFALVGQTAAELELFEKRWPNTQYAALAQVRRADILKRERAEAERRASEQREREAREQAAREQEAREQEARERETRQRETRERESREQEARVQLSRRGLHGGDWVYFYSGARLTGQLWFSGVSNFIYSGRIVSFNESNTHAAVNIERIERYWGSSPRPDPRCMPYTDEHDYTFSTPYGRFCTGETILIAIEQLTTQKDAAKRLFQ